jgi:acetyltransferase EpsM
LKRIVILGGLGDGTVVLSGLHDLIENGEDLSVLGFLNDRQAKGEQIENVPVLGSLDDTKEYVHLDDVFFISALLKAKEAYARSQKIENLRIPIGKFYTLIHPRATIARSAKIGLGTYVGPNVVVMPKVIIGNHCSFRTSVNIGHDCIIGHFAYVGPNATLSGGVVLGDGVHVGPNACIRERVKCGTFSVIGMGSVVLRDVPESCIVFGNPARVNTTTEAGS